MIRRLLQASLMNKAFLFLLFNWEKYLRKVKPGLPRSDDAIIWSSNQHQLLDTQEVLPPCWESKVQVFFIKTFMIICRDAHNWYAGIHARCHLGYAPLCTWPIISSNLTHVACQLLSEMSKKQQTLSSFFGVSPPKKRQLEPEQKKKYFFRKSGSKLCSGLKLTMSALTCGAIFAAHIHI